MLNEKEIEQQIHNLSIQPDEQVEKQIKTDTHQILYQNSLLKTDSSIRTGIYILAAALIFIGLFFCAAIYIIFKEPPTTDIAGQPQVIVDSNETDQILAKDTEMEQIKKILANNDIDGLINIVKTGTEEQRLIAAVLLGKIGNEASAQILEDLSKDATSPEQAIMLITAAAQIRKRYQPDTLQNEDANNMTTFIPDPEPILSNGCAIEIQVLDDTNNPIEKAAVYIQPITDTNLINSLPQKSTNDQGFVILDGLQKQTYNFTIVHFDELQQVFENEDDELFEILFFDFAPSHFRITLKDPNALEYKEVTLTKAKIIQGSINYADGQSAENLLIEAKPKWWNLTPKYSIAVSDQAGNFLLEHIIKDQYSVTIYDANESTIYQDSLILGDKETFEITIPAPETIEDVNVTNDSNSFSDPNFVDDANGLVYIEEI